MTLDHQGRLIIAGWSSRNVWRLEKDGSLFRWLRITGQEDQFAKRHRREVGRHDLLDRDAERLLIPGMEGNDSQRYLDWQGVFRMTPMA